MCVRACACTCIAIHRIVCIYVYVCVCIYIAESDSIYSFSPNLKMGVVYFGWKRHGSGVCPIPYGFYYLSCGLDQNNLR